MLAYGGTVTRRALPVVRLWPHVRGHVRGHMCGHDPVKVLVVRDPGGEQEDDFLLCTDPAVSDEAVVERPAPRRPPAGRPVEECIRDGKQHGGFERVQGWCPKAVRRQAPLALVVQTLVKAWLIRHAAGRDAARVRPGGHKACGWLGEAKTHRSYLDMPATLRRVPWEGRLRINHNPAPSRRLSGLWETPQFTLRAAA